MLIVLISDIDNFGTGMCVTSVVESIQSRNSSVLSGDAQTIDETLGAKPWYVLLGKNEYQSYGNIEQTQR